MSSVNLFALVSGYLYVNKKVNYNSIVNLIITTLFYSIIITAITFFVFPEIFSNLKILVSGLFPPIINRYWYLVSYVFLFFCIPYINIFIKNINKIILEKLIFIIFILFSLISTFGYVDYFRINYGYSPFWLIYCYLIGAYIKLFGLPNIFKKKKMLIWYIISTVIMFILGIITKKIGLENFFVRYNSPFVLFNSILIFTFFTNLKIKSLLVKRILQSLSSVSFEVYIVHGHYIILDYLITNNFIFMSDYSTIVLIVMMLVIITLIYIICGIIGKLKEFIFKLLKIKKIIYPFAEFLNSNLM